MKKNIIYVTIEDISSGLFISQVVTPLLEMAKCDFDRKFVIFVINRPWKIASHIKSLYRIKKSRNIPNLKIKYLPLLFPLRKSAGNKQYSSFITIYLSIIIKIFCKKKNNIIHARSYWPCAAAISAGFKNIIFEPRSLWTLENIAMGDIKENSKAETYWNMVEERCSTLSNKVISINKPMSDYFIDNYSSKIKNEVIPIIYKKEDFYFNPQERKRLRNSLRIDHKLVFSYSGSFGMSHVGKKEISKLIKKLCSSVADCHFLFITPSYELNTIEEIASQSELKNNQITIIHPEHNDISSYLSAGDIGFHALPYQKDHFTRMGTKVVEYFAIGLPVIVNSNVGAAADLISSNNLGFVIDNKMTSEEVKNNIKAISQLDRNDIIEYAQNNFEIQKVSSKYLSIYSELDNDVEKI